MTEKVEYEKSAWRVWLLALAGVPFLLVGADFFFEQKLVGAFGDLVYGAEDFPAFEPRDTILAALFLIVGLTVTLWGLKELVFPKKVLVADREGIWLAVGGPFRPATLVPWDAVADMEYVVTEEGGEPAPAVRLDVVDRGRLPVNPWGARWVSPDQMLIDVTGWSPAPDSIVEQIWKLRRSLTDLRVEDE